MNLSEKVKDIMRELSGNEEVGLTDSLQNDIGLDSLGMVTLLLAVEETFDIELDETDMNPFDLKTVADVIRLAEKYVQPC